MSKDKKQLKGSKNYTSRYSKPKFDDGGLIKKSSKIYKSKVGLGSSDELIKKERRRIYQIRYRYKKKLSKKGLTTKERDNIRKVLRHSTETLNSLKKTNLIRVQQPQSKGIKAKGKLVIEDVKTWESTDEITTMYNSGLFKTIIVGNEKFTRLAKNFPFVLDAVARLEVKADLIGAYYLTFTVNAPRKTVIIDLKF